MPLAAGTRLGAYEIRSPLGRGGGGEVYRAWDPRLERDVAIKILRESSDLDPDRVWRFVAEARAASALNHPNILTVFDAAVDGATPFIVSELIEGDSLRVELRRGPVSLKRVLDLATQISDGLAEAHSAGIVHRDLKPENVMVTPGGRAKILDFGLARSTGSQGSGIPPMGIDLQTQTVSGLLIGTVPYMSPEQARGLASDYRSDQFAFGLILYEMATGASPFRRDTPAQTLEAIVHDEPAPLTEVTPQLPLMLWWIVERCLAKTPGERYASTADLHRDLRLLRDRLSEAIGKQRALAVEPPRRSRVTRVLAAGAIAAGLLVGILLWPLVVEPAAPRTDSLRFVPFATETGYEGLPAWSPDGQTVAYSSEVNGVLQIFTRTVSSTTPAQVTEAAFDCKYPFWSADGKRIYYISMAKTTESIWSVGAAGGTPQVVVFNASRGALSPDGRTLAFLRDLEDAEIIGTAVLFFATPQGQQPWSSDAVEAAARRYSGFEGVRFVEGSVSYSPDGKRLAVNVVPIAGPPLRLEDNAQLGWQLWTVPSDGGPPTQRLAHWGEPLPRVTGFTWLPDSRHAVLSANVGSTPGAHLWMADLDDDRVWPLTQSADHESQPSASPDGQRIVYTSGEADYDIYQIATAGGAPEPMLATARKETDPRLSPDGSLLAYVTDRNGPDEIWLRSRGPQIFDRPLITQREFIDSENMLLAAPTFAPNGQSIAFVRNSRSPISPLQIFTSRTAGGPPVRLLPPDHHSYQGSPTWSPDGQWIAFAEWRERAWELMKMRVGSGEAPVVLRTDGAPNAVPQWSPKGDWITWETAAGFHIVSPDGAISRPLEVDQWLAHAWSPDGLAIYGVTETDDLRLALMRVDVAAGESRMISDLGASPPVNNPVQGFSVSADGKTIVTSIAKMRGDLWLLEGIRPPMRWWRRLLPMKTP